MRSIDFLKEFIDEQFPKELGPPTSIHEHDPPFTKDQLRQMANKGIIILDEHNWTYSLTLKATQIRRDWKDGK